MTDHAFPARARGNCGCGVNGRLCREHAAEFDAVTLSHSRPHPLVTRNAELESQVRTLQEENEAMRATFRNLYDAFHDGSVGALEFSDILEEAAALSSKPETAE